MTQKLTPEEWQAEAHAAGYKTGHLAKALHISRWQLRRHIAKQFNCTPEEYLEQKWRAAAYASLMRTRSVKISAIEVDGEIDSSNFSRRFTRLFSCTPTDFLSQMDGEPVKKAGHAPK